MKALKFYAPAMEIISQSRYREWTAYDIKRESGEVFDAPLDNQTRTANNEDTGVSLPDFDK